VLHYGGVYAGAFWRKHRESPRFALEGVRSNKPAAAAEIFTRLGKAASSDDCLSKNEEAQEFNWGRASRMSQGRRAICR